MVDFKELDLDKIRDQKAYLQAFGESYTADEEPEYAPEVVHRYLYDNQRRNEAIVAHLLNQGAIKGNNIEGYGIEGVSVPMFQEYYFEQTELRYYVPDTIGHVVRISFNQGGAANQAEMYKKTRGLGNHEMMRLVVAGNAILGLTVPEYPRRKK